VPEVAVEQGQLEKLADLLAKKDPELAKAYELEPGSS